MKLLVIVTVSICCLLGGIQMAAVEPVVTELQKDNVPNPATKTELPTNEDCIQPKETGRCFALFYRFAYDVEKGECVEFIYGGCSGNSNNFETQEECELKCLHHKPSSSGNETVLTTTVLPSSDIETTTVPANSS